MVLTTKYRDLLRRSSSKGKAHETLFNNTEELKRLSQINITREATVTAKTPQNNNPVAMADHDK